MKSVIIGWIATASMLSAAGTLEVRAPGYDWQPAEYSTSHVYIDEVAGTTADIEVGFDPGVFIDEGMGGVVEVFTNLNRRDLASTDKNVDRGHDGILPVPGGTIENIPGHTDPVTGHYYIPHGMSYDGGEMRFKVTIPASISPVLLRANPSPLWASARSGFSSMARSKKRMAVSASPFFIR